jgi:hypothetical protein
VLLLVLLLLLVVLLVPLLQSRGEAACVPVYIIDFVLCLLGEHRAGDRCHELDNGGKRVEGVTVRT